MSAWVQHVRQFAEDHRMKYGEAMSHPDCKESYHASKSQDGAGIGKAFKKVGKKLTDTKKMKYGKNVMKVMDFQNKMSQKIAGATKGIPGVNRVTGAIAMGNDKLTGFAHDVHESRKQGGSDGKIFKRALGRSVGREGKEALRSEIDDLMDQEQVGSGMYKALSKVKHAFKNTAKKGVREVKSQGKQVARKASNDAKDWLQGQGKQIANKAMSQAKDFAREEGRQTLKAVKNEAKDIYQNEGKQAIGFAKQKGKATYKQLKDTAIGEYRNKAGDAKKIIQDANQQIMDTLNEQDGGALLADYMNDNEDDEVYGAGVLDAEPTLNAKSRYPAYMVSRGGSLIREAPHLMKGGYCEHCGQHSGGSFRVSNGGSFRTSGGSFRVNE